MKSSLRRISALASSLFVASSMISGCNIIFNPTEPLDEIFESKRIAKIVVDRYLNGEAYDNM